MAPPSGLQFSSKASDYDDKIERLPPLARSITAPTGFQQSAATTSASAAASYRGRPDPSHLAPEDAFHAASPPRRLNGFESSGNRDHIPRHLYRKDGGSRSRSRRRRKRPWKKLLWVKQSYPDNYTDQGTFLENLQRNPRLKPYDFWPLVADSTVIVQHVCTVCIFVVCFVGIHQRRLSPVAVVGWGSIATSVGWFLWDWWVGKEGENDDIETLHRTRSIGPKHYRRSSRPQTEKRNSVGGSGSGSVSGGQGEENIAASQTVSSIASSSASTLPSAESSTTNLLMPPGQAPLPSANTSATNLLSVKPYSTSASSLVSGASQTSTPGTATNHSRSRRTSSPTDPAGPQVKHRPSSPLRGGRAHLRMNTIKSAILIYFTLLGLSPILKSLTLSTSSDSIWAMSFWLLAINIFFFDYSGAWVGVNKFPVASLSTNAALMASTVLASRLPSTGQVFSLTLFSIEVFGLFPVFRRYARHRSWRYHVVLTVLLVLGAGGGVGMILGGAACDEPRTCETQPWPWASALLGMVVGCLIAAVAMGGCSWWLIGLQKYKNEIYGPWDPARPIIISRRHWDDD
ncbi:hypothetical protein N8I77_010549 [Diaporthe amygdali]|uniref:Phosphatidylinositol N-acetylglucosaminyltransferase GPI2 subunit n=1 Tax=Phomopsis amygdali TaxID=1214568 RepID=A0AAD9VZI1_PHOAM|nr:hypothetical protein N8I77_010549 [Diaporthe amygdali]